MNSNGRHLSDDGPYEQGPFTSIPGEFSYVYGPYVDVQPNIQSQLLNHPPSAPNSTVGAPRKIHRAHKVGRYYI